MRGFRIRALWAWVVIGPDDDESVPAELARDTWVPLIGADEARVRRLRPMAERFAHRIGKPIRLLRFTVREEIEAIEPNQKET